MAISIVVFQSALGYPKEGRLPNLTEDSYLHETGDVAPDCGDLLFYGPDEKPPFESLTEAELLMLGGSRASEEKEHLSPYWMHIPTLAGRYYREFGVLPTLLDPAAIRRIPRFKSATDAELELYRNPLTGKWPRVDVKSQSPGDFYIRVLTPEEAKRLAKRTDTSLFILYGRMYGEKKPLVSFFSPFSKGPPGAMP